MIYAFVIKRQYSVKKLTIPFKINSTTTFNSESALFFPCRPLTLKAVYQNEHV